MTIWYNKSMQKIPSVNGLTKEMARTIRGGDMKEQLDKLEEYREDVRALKAARRARKEKKRIDSDGNVMDSKPAAKY